MGLTFFLVIVLLIALIIVASTNSAPPRTELDCENDDRLTGYQDPHSSESKHEGAPDHHPDIVVMLDTTTKPTTTKNEDGLDWINDWDEWDEDDEYSKNDGHVKSSTVTTTISTKTLIETTEQSVIETFDDIGNGLFARTVKPLFQTTQDSIQFQTTDFLGKFTMQEDSVTESTNFEDKETFDFKPFETEGEKEVQKTTVSAEIHNAIHDTTQIETKKEEKFTTIPSGIYNTIQETT